MDTQGLFKAQVRKLRLSRLIQPHGGEDVRAVLLAQGPKQY